MLTLLDPHDPRQPFPDPSQAEPEPNGLLAVGGDLSVQRLLTAYRAGIFPWYGVGQPILWWSPDPRALLFPERLRVSRSLRKTLTKGRFRVSIDRAFDGVIAGCAAPRRFQEGTWIIPEMMQAYRRLHRQGLAHSVEVWAEGNLVGGLYGVALGRAFFGESMFSREPDASKVALVHLCRQLQQWGYRLIDCQLQTDHLTRLGAETLPRLVFQDLLDGACRVPPAKESWHQPLLEDPGLPFRKLLA